MTNERNSSLTISSSSYQSFESSVSRLSSNSPQDFSPKVSRSQKSRFTRAFPEIAEAEEAIRSYHCALSGGILLQGFLYITPNWFCFYSKLFGKKCIKIPVSSISDISRKKTAIFIPNAIGVDTATDKYVFGSLMSRDRTYKVMKHVWQSNQMEAGSVSSRGLSSVRSGSSLESTDNDSFCSSCEWGTISNTNTNNSNSLDRNNRATRDSLDHRNSQPILDDDQIEENPELRFHEHCDNTSTKSPQLHSRHHHDGSVKISSNNLVLHQIILQIYKIPRTYLFIILASFLIVFLLFSSAFLTFRLTHLEKSISDLYPTKFDSNSPQTKLPEDIERQTDRSDAYKIKNLLDTNVRLLKQLNQAIENLKPVRSCSSTKDCL